MKKVRKAVLPVAGLGTRFLPATKAMPKEMLTVVDKPIIQYVVEEALEAGIEEFVFVTGRGKSAIENHFDQPYELLDTLKKRNKIKEIDLVQDIIPSHVKLYYTRQGNPLGLGHAVACAKSVIGDDPFAVLLPDDLLCGAHENALAKMIEVYDDTEKSVVLVEEIPMEKTKNYGILDLEGGVENQRAKAKGFVEKPQAEDAPSNLGVVGRYILNSRILDFLAEEKIGQGGEIQLTDAMNKLAAEEGFMGHVYNGERFDCGDKVGWQMANLHFAMKDEYIASRLLPYLQKVAESTCRREAVREA